MSIAWEFWNIVAYKSIPDEYKTGVFALYFSILLLSLQTAGKIQCKMAATLIVLISGSWVDDPV